MGKHNKLKKLNIAQQLASLKREYPSGASKIIGINEIAWQGELKSSPIGDDYLVKVIYKVNVSPKVYILAPKPLALPKGVKKLEHVYDQKKQRLCLYYPKAKEWNESKTLASTIFPWTIEWLYHYEIWVITGKWEGGGIHLNSIKTVS